MPLSHSAFERSGWELSLGLTHALAFTECLPCEALYQVSLLALGSLKGSQGSTKPLPLSSLLPYETNCLHLPRTEGFLGHRTFRFKTGKALGRVGQVGHSTDSFAVTFYKNGLPPSDCGVGKARRRVRMVPGHGNTPEGSWAGRSWGFPARRERAEQQGPLLSCLCGESSHPVLPSLLVVALTASSTFHCIESVHMMEKLSSGQTALPGS